MASVTAPWPARPKAGRGAAPQTKPDKVQSYLALQPRCPVDDQGDGRGLFFPRRRAHQEALAVGGNIVEAGQRAPQRRMHLKQWLRNACLEAGSFLTDLHRHQLVVAAQEEKFLA